MADPNEHELHKSNYEVSQADPGKHYFNYA